MDKAHGRVLARKAAQIRRHGLEAIEAAGSGHVGGSFSMAEILAALYFYKLRIDPKNPKWEERDRFVLSKGHCTPTTYAALAMRGFFPLEDLKTFRKIDSYLSGHIEMKHVPGVDMSAGSLGQGVSVAVGMALCAKAYRQGYRVYAVTGDGELQEGQIWEAAMAAAHYCLDNLRVIVDNNGLQLDGPVEKIMSLGSIGEKFRSFGWEVFEAQGNDAGQVADALDAADNVCGRPVLVLAHTVKGKGVSFFENDVKWHGHVPSPEEFRLAFAELDARIAELEVDGNGE